jgi:integrase/recombinase XerD
MGYTELLLFVSSYQQPSKSTFSESSVESRSSGQPFPDDTILGLKLAFLDYCEFDRGFSKETIIKYGDCLNCFVRTVDNLPVDQLQLEHFIQFRKKLKHRQLSDARISQVIFAMKSFLRYCREIRNLTCIESAQIRSPKRVKREVIYLTNEEIQQFLSSIKIYNRWAGKVRKRNINLMGLRFRTLVEVLLGTGMRISEALSLNIEDIDFEEGAVTIIGKGNKQRTIFFSNRSLWWIRKYLATRSDDCPALFVTHPKHTRLKRTDLWRSFKVYNLKSGLKKKVTPHILRHTFATNMLYNGCDLVTIKELLGHHDISVTARAYIGIDKRQIKENHKKYLNYEFPSS